MLQIRASVTFVKPFLHVTLRHMISKKEYTLQINLKLPVRVTSCNIFQAVKAEILAVIDH